MRIDRHDLNAAIKRSSVVWFGIASLGVAFGIYVEASGLAWWWAPTISALVFAGSFEFVLVQLLVASASLGTIAMTAALVNARHILYAGAFPLDRVEGAGAKAWSIFALTDEAYALATSRNSTGMSGAQIVMVQAGLFAAWVCGSTAGSVLGASAIPQVRGAEFSLTALFVVLAIDASRDGLDRFTGAAATFTAAMALTLAHGHALIVAMTAFVAVLAARSTTRRRRSTANG